MSRIVSVGLWNFKFSGRKLVRILPQRTSSSKRFFFVFYFVNRHDAESLKTANFGFSRSIYYVKQNGDAASGDGNCSTIGE